jgi:formate dehydrogenase iron-sulfur subunit
MIGGPLAGIIPPRLLDTRFSLEDLRCIGARVGHGGVIAFDGNTSIPQLVQHVFSFAAFESCGKCAPCRVGARCIADVFDRVAAEGAANYWDEVKCMEIVRALKLASLCGLGTGLAEFAESVLRHYAEELEPCFR